MQQGVLMLRLERHKPRHLLASLAYKLDRFLPLSRGRKLDFLLDLEWIANRLAHENASRLGLHDAGENRFLFDRVSEQDRVIDIGCGAGHIAALLPGTVFGIDYDPANIEQARKRAPKAAFICADANQYLSDHFDVAILSHVLEHIEEPEALLRSVSADRIYVEVPDFEWSLNNRMREKRKRRLIYTDPDHVFEWDRAGIEELFERCGLQVSDREFRRGVMRYWLTRRQP
jgi:SAM-dependent methyltransferase